MNLTRFQMNATTALTPALSPKEREGESATLDNSLVAVAVGAFSPFEPAVAQRPGASASPERGERFSLSPGERAGVRAGLKPFVAILFAMSFCFATAFSSLAQSYSIDRFTIDGGGGTSTGGVFSVSGTIGQPDAGKLSGGNYTVDGGFWGIIAAVQTPGAPMLSILLTATNTTLVTWPSPSAGFALQQNTDLATPNWVAATNAVTDNGPLRFILVNPPVGSRFYRLLKP